MPRESQVATKLNDREQAKNQRVRTGWNLHGMEGEQSDAPTSPHWSRERRRRTGMSSENYCTRRKTHPLTLWGPPEVQPQAAPIRFGR